MNTRYRKRCARGCRRVCVTLPSYSALRSCETCVAVARIVIAARSQGGDFEALHDTLMTQKGQLTEARALDIAAKLAFDVERLKKDAKSSTTGDALTRTQDLANRLNVTATPLYIIGHVGIAGAPDDLIEQIKKQVEEIRKSGSEVC